MVALHFILVSVIWLHPPPVLTLVPASRLAYFGFSPARQDLFR